MVTALVRAIGYDAAASIAKEAFATGRTVRKCAASGNCDDATLHQYRRAINDTEASSLMSLNEAGLIASASATVRGDRRSRLAML